MSAARGREPIAIVGMACRLPGGVSDIDGLWRLLLDGRDVVTPVPDDPVREALRALPRAFGGFLEGIDRFDHEFFTVTPREAAVMDPQQRLLLETSWNAIEDAGLTSAQLAGSSTGVFLGMMSNEYAELRARRHVAVDAHSTTGGSRNAAAGRISFALGLRGPSLVVDTDRSSSLVALHLACRSLHSGECAQALVGGANLVLTPELTEAFEQAGMLAADGRCKFADASADGFVRSEAIAVVVLKPLSSAERSGDRVYALIRGSAVTSAGNTGDLMRPSVESQQRLLRAACLDAGIAPGQLGYVEAHGTGTPTGDRVELEALGRVLSEGRSARHPCAVGSVKTNVGHCEGAAGIVGLLKTALSLHHQVLPPSLHFRQPNPRVPFAELPLRVQAELAPWPAQDSPALAGVSSFGLTGTLAHVVLERAAPRPSVCEPKAAEWGLLVWSARSTGALAEVGRGLLERLADPGTSSQSLCFTASVHRSHHEHRRAVLGRSRAGLAERVRQLQAGEAPADAWQSPPSARKPVQLVFVYAEPLAARDWLGPWSVREPAFRHRLTEAATLLGKWGHGSLLAALEARERGREPSYDGPARVAIGLALSALLQHWGIRPSAVVGVGSGELVAAQAAGVLSFEQALRVACECSALLSPELANAAQPAAALREACARRLEGLAPSAELTPLASARDGEWCRGLELDATYWAQQLGSPASLDLALRRLHAQGYGRFVEVTAPRVSTVPAALAAGLDALAQGPAAPTRELRADLLAVLGELYTAGVDVAWQNLYGAGQRRVDLPGYPWQRQRCWFQPPRQEPSAPRAAPGAMAQPRHHADRSHMDSSVQTSPALLQELQRQFARVLGKDEGSSINVTRPIFELGFTSLMELELRQGLERKFGRLETSVLFNYPSIERLAAFLSTREPRAVEPPAAPPARAIRPQPTGNGVAAEPRAMPEAALRAPAAAAPPSRAAAPSTTRSVGEARAEELEPIAIVGMACRFPGCKDLEGYWQLLKSGADAVGTVPPDRWDAEAYYDENPDREGKMVTKWGGFIADVSRFDAAFFGISPREAEAMDPQQRLLLELTWEALEHANIDPYRLRGTSGCVFVGLQSFAEYARLKTLDPLRIGAHDPAGDSISIAAGRIAYTLGLHGPAVTVDTACSSSLVALHYASLSLRRREADLALAGGANVMAAPEVTLGLAKAKMLSPRGRSRTFDASADGYVRAEGGGMLVLKRLSDAIADGDEICAVVRSTAVNQDGRSSGLTAPNGLAQEALIREALRSAGLSPADVTYVEAHGTGTPLGDPIEYQAVANVLGQGRSPQRPVLLGSVKTNIGHLESAAGVAGLMKVVLSLQHREIPAHLHLRQLNPRIDASLPARVVTEHTPWPREAPCLAAVNSFGFSGTNAHAILERYSAARPERALATPERRPLQLLTLSARSQQALRALAERYAEYLEQPTCPPLGDVAYTAQTARAQLSHRLAVPVADAGVAAHKLRAFAAQGSAQGVAFGEVQSTPPTLAFLFSGQGSHYVGMGKQLYESEPVFRRALQRCSNLAFDYLDRPLESVLYEGDLQLLQDQRYGQLALFALEYALYELWAAWGVRPAFVMGHSLGEYGAACAAGVMALEDALRVLALRGALAAELPDKGAAAAVWAKAERVAPTVAKYERELAIAAYNTPDRLLVSGSARALHAALQELEQQGIQCKPLEGLVAVHSPLMDPMLDELEAQLRSIQLSPPRIPFVSSVTGTLASERELCDPGYWRRHLRQPVRFAEAMRTLHEHGADVFLEIGPHQTLVRLGEECLPAGAATWHTCLHRERGAWEQLFDTVAGLHARGVSLDFAAFQRNTARRTVKLPGYAWQGGSYWVRPSPRARGRGDALRELRPRQRLLGERLRSPLRAVQFESTIATGALPFLRDHELWRTVVIPGAFHLERVLTAGSELLGTEHLLLEDLVFPEAVVLANEDESRLSQLVLSPQGNGSYAVQVSTLNSATEKKNAASEEWRIHLQGALCSAAGQAPREAEPERSAAELLAAAPQLSGAELYSRMTSWGYGLGPAFQWLQGLVRSEEGCAWFRLQMPAAARPADAAMFHPALLDALFQSITHVPTANGVPPSADALYVPVRVARLECFRRPVPGSPLLCQVRSLPAAPNERLAELQLYCEGQLCAELSGVQLKLARRDVLLRSPRQTLEDALYQLAWEQVPLLPSAELELRSRAAGSWLIVCDDELGAGLAAQLEQVGETCSVVRAGPQLVLDGGQLRARLTHPEDLQRVLEHAVRCAQAAGSPLRGVVYAGGVPDASARDSAADIEPVLAQAARALQLARGLSALPAAESARLWLITRGTQQVEDGDPADLAASFQAPLWGIGRTIASELPGVWGGLVDLPRTADPAQLGDLFEHLWHADGQTEVALRAGGRWSGRLHAVLRPQAPGLGAGRLREHATYLITGGLGGLGVEVAQALVERGARHLALLGRSGERGRSAAALAALRATGVRVSVVQVDIADFTGLASALQRIEQELPPLAGVVHAAGVLDDALISDQSWAHLAKVFAPKVCGALHLHALLSQRPLDFFLHFSSVAALIGNHGQANYAAANAFLDSFAEVQRRHGVPAVSVNWGPWGEVGMAASLAGEFYQRWGLHPISPRQGAELAVALTRHAAAGVTVMPCDWQQFARVRAASGVPAPFTRLAQAEGAGVEHADGSDLRERLSASPREARRALLLEAVRGIVADILGVEDASSLHHDQRMEDFGVDSLLSMAVLRALQTRLKVVLAMNAIMLHPTLNRLTDHLYAELDANAPEELAAQ